MCMLRITCLASFALMGCYVPCGHAAPPVSAPAAATDAIRIDPARLGHEISPLLFGHNIENTRHAVWRGLSAQLIANRKFAGPSGPGGLAAHWLGIGIDGVTFSLDRQDAFTGDQSQRVSIAPVSINKANISGGIAQEGIPLFEGVQYEARVWIDAHAELPMLVRLCDRLKQVTYARQDISPGPVGWRPHAFTFTAPRTDPCARIEITGTDAGGFRVGAVSLLPADNFHGMRRDVVKLLKEMSAPLLRWPGGNFTRDYRWEQGLLPVDRRPPIHASWPEVLPFTEGFDFHEIGTDEFLALCAELKAAPSITINIADAAPQEAAAWIQYCNGAADTRWGKVRAERGHPEPYAVKYWSIGNEIYANWMGPAHTDAATYARRIGEYAKAMKEADPTIVLIASGAAGAPVAEEGWDRKVVAGAGGHFDHIAEHHYAKTRGDAPEELERLAKIPTTELLTKWRAARENINAAAPAGKLIGIAFDEWNIWHPWFTGPHKLDWHVGSRDGIYVASLLNMLCRESASLGIAQAAFFQPVNEGAIAVNAFKAKWTPIGQVFSLFIAHHGNRLIRTEALPGDADVDICASRDVGGRRVAITLVNRHAGSHKSIRLSFPSTLAIDGISSRYLIAEGIGPDDGLADRSDELVVPADHQLDFPIPGYSAALLHIRLRPPGP